MCHVGKIDSSSDLVNGGALRGFDFVDTAESRIGDSRLDPVGASSDRLGFQQFTTKPGVLCKKVFKLCSVQKWHQQVVLPAISSLKRVMIRDVGRGQVSLGLLLQTFEWPFELPWTRHVCPDELLNFCGWNNMI
jgi:hypothetical protein